MVNKTAEERIAELREEFNQETRVYCKEGISREIARLSRRAKSGLDWDKEYPSVECEQV